MKSQYDLEDLIKYYEICHHNKRTEPYSLLDPDNYYYNIAHIPVYIHHSISDDEVDDMIKKW